MTSDDMFGLFQANANGMAEFAKLAGEEVTPRRLQSLVPFEIKAESDTASKRSWWERVGLVPKARKSRRRLAPAKLETGARTALG